GGVVVLGHRRPDKRARLFRDVEILTPLCNADNLSPWSSCTPETESLADRISRRLHFRHQPPDKVFVNNRHPLSLLLVRFSELATLQDRGAHRFEVSWPSIPGHGHGCILATLGGPAFDVDNVAVEVESKRDITRHRRRFDARQRLQTFAQLAIELLPARLVVAL